MYNVHNNLCVKRTHSIRTYISHTFRLPVPVSYMTVLYTRIQAHFFRPEYYSVYTERVL